MENLLKNKLKEFCLLKYPKRFKSGIRAVQERQGLTEVWSKDSDVLYFSETFMNELKDGTR